MSAAVLRLVFDAWGETLYMVAVSGGLAFLGGVPLGVLLAVTGRGGLLQNLPLSRMLGVAVNAARSTPFVILMVAILPLTRWIVGTSIGTTAAVVPLSLAALPFMGRVVEGALRGVDRGVVEASLSMGATPLQIIVKVLLPEALPALLSGTTLMFVNLVGYSAMAGAFGGGGLGDLAVRFGHQRNRPDVMLVTVVVLIVMVQGVQSVGDAAGLWIRRRRGQLGA